jgi:hypothetical protein
MALTKACQVSTALKNTGIDCDVSLGPTAMLAACPKNFTFSSTDFVDPLTWFIKNVNEVPSKRVYPIFGNNAPVRGIANNKEADVIATLDDGSQTFIRYGFINKVLSTTNGGLCYAAALQSFIQSGYRIIEFDKTGKMLARDNRDGTYTGLRCDFMYSPSPDVADFANPWKTNFQVSFDPVEYVTNGVILSGAQSLLDIDGLLDAQFVDKGPHTITALKVGLQTACGGTDLVTLLGTPLNVSALYKVTNATTGAVIPITTVTQAGGVLSLNGTFVAATKYNVTGTDAQVWYTNSIIGYDGNSMTLQVTTP